MNTQTKRKTGMPNCCIDTNSSLFRITKQWYIVVNADLDAMTMYSFGEAIYYFIRGNGGENVLINYPTPTQAWHLRETKKLAKQKDWPEAIKALRAAL